MAELPQHPTLPDLQRYMATTCQERGWDKDSPAEKFVLFIEEVGELAKAMRNAAGLYAEPARTSSLALEEEMADVLSYLLDLANCYGVDLEAAFRAKDAVNQTRTWE